MLVQRSADGWLPIKVARVGLDLPAPDRRVAGIGAAIVRTARSVIRSTPLACHLRCLDLASRFPPCPMACRCSRRDSSSRPSSLSSLQHQDRTESGDGPPSGLCRRIVGVLACFSRSPSLTSRRSSTASSRLSFRALVLLTPVDFPARRHLCTGAPSSFHICPIVGEVATKSPTPPLFLHGGRFGPERSGLCYHSALALTLRNGGSSLLSGSTLALSGHMSYSSSPSALTRAL